MDGVQPGVLTRRTTLLLIAYGVTLFLVHTGSGWVLTYHEAFFAVPAREMLRTGDWIVPRVVGVPAWQKPPFMHWLIAATMGLLGSQSEWAARLPSLVATILNAWLIAFLTARWYGDRRARLAGLIQLTCFYVLFQGRLAECDMPLCAAVTGAMACLAWGTIDREQSTRWLRYLFFALAGVASLIKGPFALALIGGAAGGFALWERRRSVWRFLLDPLGWIIMIALALAWPLAAYHADSSLLESMRVHNLDRFSGTYEGAKNPFFYVYIIPLIMMPWTPMAFAGLWAILRGEGRPVGFWRLMICWMIVGLAIIQASAWKHKHYAIPMLPPLSIAAAWCLDRLIRRGHRVVFSLPVVLSVILMILASLGVSLFLSRGEVNEALISGIVLLAGAGLLATLMLKRFGRIDAATASLFATIWAVVILTESLVMPRFDLYREPTSLALRTNALFDDGRTLYQIGVPNPQLSFYLRWPMKRIDQIESLVNDLAMTSDPGERTVITPEAMLPELARFGHVEVIDGSDCKYQYRLVAFRPHAMAHSMPSPAISAKR